MKSILFVLVASFLGASTAMADVCAMYACILSTSKDKSVGFPLMCENGEYSAQEPGETSIFQLTAADASQTKGLPAFKNGTYYAGGNDVFVLIKNDSGTSIIQVIKPYEMDPNTNQRSTTYNCTTIQF